MPRDLAANLPETVRLNFPTHACGTATVDGIPDGWHEDADLADAEIDGSGAGYPFTFSIVDSCAAIYSVNPSGGDGPPKNQDHLRDLAKIVARDFWQWRTVAYDREYAGVIAPDLEGLTDIAEWSYREGDCSTRLTSTPPDVSVDRMNHADADDCAPGVGVYLSQSAATVTGTTTRSLKIHKGKLRIVRGRLVAEQDGDDSIALC